MKIKTKGKRIAFNTGMLMILNIAKLVFPFLTLPYLTRVLSTDCYGVVTYVKAVMYYFQVIIDFGFILSATKQVVIYKNDPERLNKVVSLNLYSKLLLAFACGIVAIFLIFIIPLLRNNVLFTILSYITVCLTIFLMDFLFRGIEKMHIITLRFVIMKSISTILTFLIVKNDGNYLMIPILDILGSLAAVAWIAYELKKLNIKIVPVKLRECFTTIKESFVYFLSNAASTSFNVLNTLVAGIVLTTTEIAYWGVCMQIVSAAQAMYTPISDAIYPEMIRSKDLKTIYKALLVFTPLIVLGCMFCFFFGKWALYILGGEKYIVAESILRALIPVMFLGFYAVIFGWPALGAINKPKEVTISTMAAAISQVIIIAILLACGSYTLISMAITRSTIELIMVAIRLFYVRKYRTEFLR